MVAAAQSHIKELAHGCELQERGRSLRAGENISETRTPPYTVLQCRVAEEPVNSHEGITSCIKSCSESVGCRSPEGRELSCQAKAATDNLETAYFSNGYVDS